MSESRFKTMRHIETVRNYLSAVIRELMTRAEQHDQSKLAAPEVEIFEEYTPKLRDCTYGSDEYRQFLAKMTPALVHHNAANRHHPEHHGYWECNGCFARTPAQPNTCPVCGYSQFQRRETGIQGMNLVDLLEMLCDWKAATLRHNDGDIRRSLEINQKRFGYSDELKGVLLNTVEMIEGLSVGHHAEQS